MMIQNASITGPPPGCRNPSSHRRRCRRQVPHTTVNLIDPNPSSPTQYPCLVHAHGFDIVRSSFCCQVVELVDG